MEMIWLTEQTKSRKKTQEKNLLNYDIYWNNDIKLQRTLFISPTSTLHPVKTENGEKKSEKSLLKITFPKDKNNMMVWLKLSNVKFLKNCSSIKYLHLLHWTKTPLTHPLTFVFFIMWMCTNSIHSCVKWLQLSRVSALALTRVDTPIYTKPL